MNDDDSWASWISDRDSWASNSPTARRTIKNRRIIDQYLEEEELRQKHPALQDLYEQYQAMVKLVKQS